MNKELQGLANSGYYPFHMPGHKRRNPEERGLDPYSQDITEIDGFDNLHDPQGLIKELNQRLRDRFGGEEARILVNGSTAGVLAAISAAVPKGGKLIMAANSHGSAYNAVALRDLSISLISPEEIPEMGAAGGISPEETEKIIRENPDAKAVFITSPTYEGVVSDVKRIAKICHSNGVILIIDSAHGAHAGIYEPFTREFGLREPCASGADIVIKSLHKTLPCFTQTALISVSGDRVDREKLWKYYSVYQTSSPSYVLMAGAERMLTLLDEKGEELYEKLRQDLAQIRREAEGRSRIKIVGPQYIGSYSVYGFDPTKLLLYSEELTGQEIYRTLRERYRLQGEMAAGRYALLMTSPMDTREGFERLSKALSEMETGDMAQIRGSAEERQPVGEALVPVLKGAPEGAGDIKVSEALEGEKEWIPLRTAENRIAAGFIYAYPPGIPVALPGRGITKETGDRISDLIIKGLSVKGLRWTV